MGDLISVIIPVYNVRDYLRACLDSVLRQTYTQLEIILIDDGSTDGSDQICDEYENKDSRIYIIHKKNGGLSDARNKGLDIATGKYVVFIDSDDIVADTIIEYLYCLVHENQADIGVCDLVHCYSGQAIEFEGETQKQVFSSEYGICEMLYQKTFLVSAGAKLFPIEYFDDIRFPVGLLFEDSAVMYKLFDKADKIVYGNSKQYGYMHRENSITTKKFSERDLDILIICDEMLDFAKKKSECVQRATKAYICSCAYRVYLNSPRTGIFLPAIKHCEQLINQYGAEVYRDVNSRKKVKYAWLCYKFFKPILKWIYKRVDRWS